MVCVGPATLLLLAALPPDPALADAANFRVPPAVARAGWQMACKHKTARRNEVWSWNPPGVAAAWEAECDWRRDVWDELDNVLFHPCHRDRKVLALRCLRRLLGDEAYFSGKLPAPIPTYRD